MPLVKPILLDGSTLEGGGQLVRVALSLSALTSTPITITNIRANRSSNRRPSKSHQSKVDGGLKESHLAAVQFLAQSCNAYTEGAEIGSRELTFIPNGLKSKSVKYVTSQQQPSPSETDTPANTITLRNPGSVFLILQALLPYLALQPSTVHELVLHGGTDVSKSMSADYVSLVLIPALSRIGIDVSLTTISRGWGSPVPCLGHVVVRITPRENVPDFSFEDQGKVVKILVKIIAGDEDMKRSLVEKLSDKLAERFEDVDIEVLDLEDSGDPRRIYVLLVAETSTGWRFGRDWLGSGRTLKNDREKRDFAACGCEAVVKELRREVARGGCVDEFLQDQLVIFQALAGQTVVDGGQFKGGRKGEEMVGDESGSLHTRTVRWVCEKMLKGIGFEEGGKCQGISWVGTGMP